LCADALYNGKDLIWGVISFMIKRILGAGIALSLFILVSSCYAVDFGSNGNNSTSLNNTTALNITNTTLNPLNGTIDSILGKSANKSELWSWGDVPAGYVRKDGKIVPESISEADESVMETPSMLSPNPNTDLRAGGLLVRPE
jgi:hypothetical protein